MARRGKTRSVRSVRRGGDGIGNEIFSAPPVNAPSHEHGVAAANNLFSVTNASDREELYKGVGLRVSMIVIEHAHLAERLLRLYLALDFDPELEQRVHKEAVKQRKQNGSFEGFKLDEFTRVLGTKLHSGMPFLLKAVKHDVVIFCRNLAAVVISKHFMVCDSEARKLVDKHVPDDGPEVGGYIPRMVLRASVVGMQHYSKQLSKAGPIEDYTTFGASVWLKGSFAEASTVYEKVWSEMVNKTIMSMIKRTAETEGLQFERKLHMNMAAMQEMNLEVGRLYRIDRDQLSEKPPKDLVQAMSGLADLFLPSANVEESVDEAESDNDSDGDGDGDRQEMIKAAGDEVRAVMCTRYNQEAREKERQMILKHWQITAINAKFDMERMDDMDYMAIRMGEITDMITNKLVL